MPGNSVAGAVSSAPSCLNFLLPFVLHLRKHPCCRYAALSSTVELLPYIGIALQEVKDDREYQANWDRISTILRGIQNFSFVYAIVVCSNVMASTKSLCTKLQGMNRDIKWL